MSVKKTIVAICLCLIFSTSFAQKKYTGLLWEITGNGLKKPSYLYGTMHVSKKLVFRLGEPFYKAISEVDVVATELNPDTWFEDFVNSDEYSLSTGMNGSDYSYRYSSRKLTPYQLENNRVTLLKNSFAYDPSMINNLMYRTSRSMEDFEESTFLDLYIYKCGKKMGKKIAGVETFDELGEAMKKATRGSYSDREEETPMNPKDRMSAYGSRDKIEEAYRMADLDMLDSLGRIGRTKGEAEFILYNRNKIMGQFIDSVTKKQRLFIGVGAAHLPGPKGVIEWLRAKGYKVRAIDMGERDAEERVKLDSIVYLQPMNTYTSHDSFFSVSAPGKMHDMSLSSEESSQIATDPVNGAYYTVHRILSSSFLGNESEDHVYRTIDSMLYEYVPGDILENKKIEKSGYKGFDITNKTRRGDVQRYQIFVTPNEVLIFKINGTGNFVYSEQAKKFFESITLKPDDGKNWQTFHSPDKTFSINAPANAHSYYAADINSTDSKFLMVGSEKSNSNRYFVFKHVYYVNDYIEEDSFELAAMAENFSEQPKYKEYSRTMTTYDGRPALRVKYTTPDARRIETMMMLNQRNYYIVGVYYDKDSSANKRFLESFKISNVPYDSFYWYTDTNLRCTVKLPYKPKGYQGSSNSYNSYSYNSYNEGGDKLRNFYKPGCDEVISVSYATYNKYRKMEDTTYLKRARQSLSLDFYQTLNNEKLTKTKDGWTLDVLVTDTASTMQIRKRWILKNGTRYVIQTYIDPVVGESDFSKTFFATFTPKDTAIGLLPWVPKGALYLKDLFSKDSLTQEIAINNSGGDIEFDSTDLKGLMKALKDPPKGKKNIDLKRDLYGSFAETRDKEAIDFLKSEYAKYADSVEYEGAILSSLAYMKTPASIAAFKELLLNEQPVGGASYKMEGSFEPLIDSPQLAKDLFPDMYALLAIDDYKEPVYKLLASMVESKQITPQQYRDKLLSILTDAKLTYKRQKNKDKYSYSYNSDDDNKRKDVLEYYNALLVPFADSPQVRAYFNKILLQTKPELRAATAALMYKKGKAVPDSIWTSIASSKKGMIALYDELRDDTLLHLFPVKLKKPEKFVEEMANNYLTSHYSYGYDNSIENKDSLKLIYQTVVHLDKDSGMAYFFKMKSGKDKFWRTRIIGLQPLKKDTFTTYNQLYTKEEYYLDEKKDVKEQFETALREILKDKAKNKNPYYSHRYDYTKRSWD